MKVTVLFYSTLVGTWTERERDRGCDPQVYVLDELLDKVEALPLSLYRIQLGTGLVVHFRASQTLPEF